MTHSASLVIWLCVCQPGTPSIAGQTTVRSAADLSKAVEAVRPGDRIMILPGVYEVDLHAVDTVGRADARIEIRGAISDQPPVLRVGRDGLRFSNAANLSLTDVIIESDHGTALVIDNTGLSTPERHEVVLNQVTIRCKAERGASAALQMRGITGVTLSECCVESVNSDGSAIELENCHQGLVQQSMLDGNECSGVGLWIHGGSHAITVDRCRSRKIAGYHIRLGSRAVGSSAPIEADRITIRESEFADGIPVALGNAKDCRIANNVVYRPRSCVVDIKNAVPAEHAGPMVLFTENIVVWRRGDLSDFARVESSSIAAAFNVTRNYWYCEDDPRSSRLPDRRFSDDQGVYGEDPHLFDPSQGDLRPFRTREGMRRASQKRIMWLSWLPRPRSALWMSLIGIVTVGAAVRIHRNRRQQRTAGECSLAGLQVGHDREAWTASTGGHPNGAPVGSLRRTFGAMTILLACVFIYGSLVPLTFRAQQWSVAVEQFRNIPRLSIDIYHLADWMANILLYMPLSFCGTLAVVAGRRVTLYRLCLLVLISAALVVLSFAIEFAQLWFPPRTVSQNDILAECLGVILGVVAGLLASRWIVSWWREFQAEARPSRIAVALLQIYAIGYLAYAILPLDLVRTYEELQLKWGSGRVGWVWSPFTSQLMLELAAQGAASIPVGALMGMWCRYRRSPRPLLQAAVWCVLTALMIECLHIVVFTRHAVFTSAVWTAFCMILGSRWGAVEETRFNALWTGPAARSRRGLLLALSAIYALVLVEVIAQPWDARAVGMFERVQQFWFPPFALLYWGTEFRALTAILRAMFLFMPLGFAMADIAAGTKVRTNADVITPLIIVALSILAAALELLQAGRSDATVDSTITMFYLVGAGLGWYVRGLLDTADSTNPEDPCVHRARPLPRVGRLGVIALASVAVMVTGVLAGTIAKSFNV